MNILTQEARRRQGVVKLALKKGKSYAACKYGVSLSSVKRWSKRYDGTWQSLKERSHTDRTIIRKGIPKQKNGRSGSVMKDITTVTAGTESSTHCANKDIPEVSVGWYTQRRE